MQTQAEATLREKVDNVVRARRAPLLATTSTSAAIAELIAHIGALEEALLELAEAVGATDKTVYAANDPRSSDRLSDSIS